MLDLFVIFDRYGRVLFRARLQDLHVPIACVDALIRDVLLQEKAAQSTYTSGATCMQWLLVNEFDLVLVAGYPKLLPPRYVPALFERVRDDFLAMYDSVLRAPCDSRDTLDATGFEKVFRKLYRSAEEELLAPSVVASRTTSSMKPASKEGVTSKKSQTKHQESKSSGASEKAREEPHASQGEQPATSASSEQATESVPELTEEQILENRRKLLSKKVGGKKKPSAQSKSKRVDGSKPEDNDTVQVAEDKPLKLDYSDHAGEDAGVDRAVSAQEVKAVRDKFLLGEVNEAYDIIQRSDDEDDESAQSDGDEDEENDADDAVVPRAGAAPAAKKASSSSSSMLSFWKRLTGQSSLSKEDLEPVLQQFKTTLIGKNVAQNIAEKIVQSVGASVEGKRLESMKSVKSAVREALHDALTRLLTPKQSTEVLADIEKVNAIERRPFVIVVCGVNGVGKSTSLAKTCFYLQKHGKKVLIAACDTFRAGAVEQLKTHAACLNVELYHQGYGKDAATVAKEAVRRGTEIGVDVVLVDTAGRMQHNEPLMRALAKLVSVNQPDRIFFVGEALVGNDAVDQLSSFNKALMDFQKVPNPRLIDGIILTKFDTIDDKVGAAVSMVYTTGQPIVFVGVGQTYYDLRKVSTSVLVNALLR
ncbi:Signal recognition particle receptor subunit alpha [Porphyridium purpureum]|uniref:Signal recognition particle receptor subunit alpha n=1 Tax=Porphyridium purpureum TaxID=35688 RepID=A0A5J4YV38_PORPP|nr:Signal recognition particle receptor subunit alpha [Porphyridium purpureum]|eukprot:POR4558..scf227_4